MKKDQMEQSGIYTDLEIELNQQFLGGSKFRLVFEIFERHDLMSQLNFVHFGIDISVKELKTAVANPFPKELHTRLLLSLFLVLPAVKEDPSQFTQIYRSQRSWSVLCYFCLDYHFCQSSRSLPNDPDQTPSDSLHWSWDMYSSLCHRFLVQGIHTHL
ncbi:Uncharacterized protein Rs2_38807 [Raphanus sativus]|nr:Uncharacterized protein Rs2_38807 [Raphanus sativus]